jgi:hypothetical protein
MRPVLENVMPQFDQLALACRDAEEQKSIAKAWHIDVEDEVTAVGFDKDGNLIKNVATLMFDHTSWPMEFELLYYRSGWNWLRDMPATKSGPYLSHLGIHVQSVEAMLRWREGRRVLQEVVTVDHANPACADRRYHYVILDTQHEFGATLKLIRRLTLPEADALLHEFALDWRGPRP